MLSGKATVLENIPFSIEPERVLREMKISKIRSLKEIEERPLAEMIKRAIDRAYTLIHGKGVFKTYRLGGADNGHVAGEGIGDVFTGANMRKLLGGCDWATLMACTIGPELEGKVAGLQAEGELAEAYALEMVGGWMADYMADRVDEAIEREIRKLGYDRTMRYSPGYGDWPLEKQPQALALAEAGRIEIELTESNIMIPRKSVSAVIGWKRKR